MKRIVSVFIAIVIIQTLSAFDTQVVAQKSNGGEFNQSKLLLPMTASRASATLKLTARMELLLRTGAVVPADTPPVPARSSAS